MPKRSYPFNESFSSQYKIHVGQKELNHHGVFGNINRQEIYEKTKNLLFNGTKAVMGRIWKVDGEEKYSNTDSSGQNMALKTETSQTLLKGQTLIGLDGKLKKCSSAAGAGTATAVCCVCQKASGSKRPCSLCDRSACSTCMQQCSNCSNLCCSICSTIDYSDRYEKVLCCGCGP